MPGPLTTFRRIIFPSLRPALLAGMALAFARAIGEIGSLVLISGNLPFKTQIDPLFILALIESGAPTGAAAVSVVLARDRAGACCSESGASHTGAFAMTARGNLGRYGLRFFALGYLAVLLLIPVGTIFYRAFEHGLDAAWDSVTTPDALHAFYLTILISLIAVVANTIFGVGCALLLVRTNFRGKALLNAVVDLPFAISPVVVGLSLYLLYGRTGWFGSVFLDNGIQILFALPGMILATIFVSLPFVVREVVPVLHEIGDEQEQAARTLGANWWQTFRRVTLPAIRWGVAYGVVLTTARALGEFGAVAVVSGRISDQTGDRAPVGLAGVRAVQHDRGLHGVAGAGADRGGDSARNEFVQTKGSVMSIIVEGARKQFGDFVALDDVSIEVPDGSLTALLGPSGSGKSTLLRVIAGLEEPDSGRVLILGEDATSLPAQNRGVGFVFQHYAAFKHMTVQKQHRLRPEHPKAPEEGDRRAGGRADQARPSRRIRRPLPLAALRRPAPAHGARTGARGRAQGAAARRAVRGAGCERSQGASAVASPPPRGGPRDDDLRHPRPGGGDGGRRADRRHERGPRRADRASPPISTSIRRRSS